MCEAAMSEAGATTAARESTGPALGTETDGTIVIVDDDWLLSQTLAMNLEDAGFSSTAFREGRAAVQYLANGGRAIAVVLDWQMPGMDGGRVLEALRALACAIPVIVVSGDACFKGPALAGGAADFIEKSKSFEILLAHLKVALGRPGTTQGGNH
jgi:two-component system response regulator ChvI